MSKKTTKLSETKALSRLIESEFAKAELAVAAKSISTKIQSIVEDLANIEPKDLVPLMDQLKDGFGPQVADRFRQTVTDKVRELMNSANTTKDAIDAEITNLENIAAGESPVTNDMGASDVGGDVPDMNDPLAHADGDTLGGDIAADEPPVPADDELGDMPDLSASGRAKKESFQRRGSKLSETAIKKLRESADPDALILSTFRALLKKVSVSEAAKHTAGVYQIDVADVVQIIREKKEKESKKNPFGKKCPPFKGVEKNDKKKAAGDSKKNRPFNEAEFIKPSSRYRAKWNDITHHFDIVDATGKVVAPDVTPNEDRAKMLAGKYRPGMSMSEARKIIAEAQPVPPMTPADKRAKQDQDRQNQQGKTPQQTTPAPSGINMPGKPMTSVPKPPAVPAAPQQPQQPAAPQANAGQPSNAPATPSGANGKPQVGPTNTKLPQGQQNQSQQPNQNVDPNAEMTDEEAPAVANGAKSPETKSARKSGNGGGTTLFSTNTPLPAPKHDLLAGGSAPAVKTQESATVGATCAANIASLPKAGGPGFFGSNDQTASIYKGKKKKNGGGVLKR